MPAKTQQVNVSGTEGSEIIEDRQGAYAVLAHNDGGVSVALSLGATAEDEELAFSLVPDGLVLSSTALGTGEAWGDRYFYYATA